MKPCSFLNNAAIFICLAASPSACWAGKTEMVVAVPVLDVRSEPHTTAQSGVHDPQEETQLIYGERIRVIEERDGWAKIEALEQAEFSHKNRWQGYPGWVPLSSLFTAPRLSEPTIVIHVKWAKLWKDPYRAEAFDWQLPLGALLSAVDMGGQFWKVELIGGGFAWINYSDALSLQNLSLLPSMEKRKLLLETALLFLGDPYLWGGRSPQIADERLAATGVDCSGLSNLAYRSIGIAIPRDAHEQYLKATPVETPQPGDLIFLSEKGNPKRIVHVMLYTGQSEILEAPGSGGTVRRIGVTERLGQTLDFLSAGSVVAGQSIYYGSYLSTKKRG